MSWFAGAEGYGLINLEEGSRAGQGCLQALLCKQLDSFTLVTSQVGKQASATLQKSASKQLLAFGRLRGSTVIQVNLPSWVNFPDFERVGWLNSVMGGCLLCPQKFYLYELNAAVNHELCNRDINLDIRQMHQQPVWHLQDVFSCICPKAFRPACVSSSSLAQLRS